jgi:hypothetical protein
VTTLETDVAIQQRMASQASVRRLRIFTGSALLSSAVCTYAGVKVLKRHPVVGGLLGFFIAAPIINYGLKMAIAPDDSFATLAASDAPPPPDRIVREGTPTPVPDQPFPTHGLVRRTRRVPVVANPAPVFTFIPFNLSSANASNAATETENERVARYFRESNRGDRGGVGPGGAYDIFGNRL